jgi:hypothetical protein
MTGIGPLKRSNTYGQFDHVLGVAPELLPKLIQLNIVPADRGRPTRRYF